MQLVFNVQEKVIKKNLEILILFASEKKKINGYEITRFIRVNFDVWLSSGTVYSILQALENKQLLDSFEKGKTRYYTLTKKGKKMLKIMHYTLKKLDSLLEKSP